MKVLGLASYPVEAAATRFRLAQFVEPLREHGIDLTVSPFMNAAQFKRLYAGGGVAGKAASMISPVLKRLGQTLSVGKYDVILLQREAMFFGPAIFEWLYRTLGRLPVVLDLDDATYVSYVSPSYGKIGSFFKAFGKTDKLIEKADLVICGNRFIADYVENKGTKAVVIPTIADTEVFRPTAKENKVPVIGWIGTHSTFPFLEFLFPVLERLATKHEFVLKVVGSGRDEIKIKGVEVENLAWSLEREAADFASLDIGLYPITVSDSASEEWLKGKSGFKAIQYLAVGVPFVMSPVGVCAEMGEADVTHIEALTDDDWFRALDRLLSDRDLRTKMGEAARQHSVEHYSVPVHAKALSEALRSVTSGVSEK
ncbi:MAG: glycosyltransferase family 4 protein [Pyrinomonadaceae bacterium]